MQKWLVLARASGGDSGSIVVILVVLALGYAGYRAYRASQQETSESRTIKSLPPSIQHVVSNMDRESRNPFFNEYEKKKGKKSTGWMAWLVLGLHYLYVGKVGVQFAFWFHRRRTRDLADRRSVPDAEHHPLRQRTNRQGLDPNPGDKGDLRKGRRACRSWTSSRSDMSAPSPAEVVTSSDGTPTSWKLA